MSAEFEALWRIEKATTPTLPVLVRQGMSANVSTNLAGGVANDIVDPSNIFVYANVGNKPIEEINVVQNFAWTKSPPSSRTDVPFISLTEKRILLNSVVSNIANSVLATAQVIQTNVPEEITQTAIVTVEDLAKAIQASVTQSIQDNPILKGAVNIFRQAKGVFESQAQKFTSPVLQPYNNLYAVEDTGFKYKLPYFNDNYDELTASYNNNTENFLGGLGFVAGAMANIATDLTTFLKPGTYIEQSKQFALGDQGRSINISFPLLNTGSILDITKNWQLLFALVYQNKPGRVTRSIIDVPVIYEVNYPGVIYMPFAFISNLSIEFLGSRRVMNIQIPQGFDVPNINATIPDAYKVNITLTGLNPDTRNFMFAGINPNVVTVNPRAPETAVTAAAASPAAAPQQPTGGTIGTTSIKRNTNSFPNMRGGNGDAELGPTIPDARKGEKW